MDPNFFARKPRPAESNNRCGFRLLGLEFRGSALRVSGLGLRFKQARNLEVCIRLFFS